VHPQTIHAGPVIVIAAAATVINLVAARFLDDHSHDLNLRGAWLHMTADACTSAGVAVAAIVIAVTGGNDWLDPAVSLLIALVIAVRAVQLLGATTSVLLESTPPDLDPAELAAAMAAVPGVEAVHDLHVWSLSSEYRALSAHLVLVGQPSLAEAQLTADAVKRMVAADYGIAHATLEPEAEVCGPELSGRTHCAPAP
jgi:cobalt-zinc-cadmium efflux system protein